MIYVTHDQIEAMTLADRIAIMKDGLVQQLDDPRTIYNNPVNKYVAGFIGSPGMNFLDGQLKAGEPASFKMAEGSVDLTNYAFKETFAINTGDKVNIGFDPKISSIFDQATELRV